VLGQNINTSYISELDSGLRLLGILADSAPQAFVPYFPDAFTVITKAYKSPVSKHPKIHMAVLQGLTGVTVAFFATCHPEGCIFLVNLFNISHAKRRTKMQGSLWDTRRRHCSRSCSL
jgi:hypothetical protein